MNSKVFSQNGLTVRVSYIEDESPDYSYYGHFTSAGKEFCIDRKTGILYGEHESHEESQPDEENAERRVVQLQGEGWHDAEWFEEDGKYTVYYSGFKPLRTGLGCTWERNTFQFFRTSDNHLPHHPENWDHVQGEELEKVIAEFGSIENADIHYAIQDWERVEALCKGDWHYVGIEVTVSLNSRVIGQASCWGFESDSGKEFFDEEEKSIITEALANARKKAPAKIDELRADAVILQHWLDESEEE